MMYSSPVAVSRPSSAGRAHLGSSARPATTRRQRPVPGSRIPLPRERASNGWSGTAESVGAGEVMVMAAPSGGRRWARTYRRRVPRDGAERYLCDCYEGSALVEGKSMSHDHHKDDTEEFTPEFWDARYGAIDRLWSGNPNPQLVAQVADLDPGTALDVGCGEGADAIWLASQGWQVTAVDVSKVALRRGAEQAARQGSRIA